MPNAKNRRQQEPTKEVEVTQDFLKEENKK